MSEDEDVLRLLIGPDRILPCGCRVINGAICMVSKANLPNPTLYARPGRFVTVSGVIVDD